MSKVPSMWLFVLFLLGISSAAEGGVTLSDARHLPPHDSCILGILLCDDFKVPLTFSESSEDLFQTGDDLEKVCRRLTRYIFCMEKAEARCKMDPRRFPISDKMIENRKFVKDICAPDSELKDVYLMHSACINKHSNRTVKICVDKVLDASPETYEKGAYEEECRHDTEIRKCHLKEMKERCGTDAAGLLRKLTVFRTGLDFQCSIFKEETGTETKVETSDLEEPKSYREPWRFLSFLEDDLLIRPTSREFESRGMKKVKRLPESAVPSSEIQQKPLSVQTDTVTVTRSTMLVDPLPEDIVTQADTETTILTTETSLRNDAFPEATTSYSDSETIDAILQHGYAQEMPTILTTEPSLGADAFPEVTNSYEDDASMPDGSVHGIPSRITTTTRGTLSAAFTTEPSLGTDAFPEVTNSYEEDVSMPDGSEHGMPSRITTTTRGHLSATFTTEPSVSNSAFHEAQTLHLSPDAVDPTLPEGYLHENRTTFGLYEVLGENESYYLGCGKAITLWATNLPLKNVFCAWLNVGSSQKLFKCSIHVGEACSPRVSIEWFENDPTAFLSRQITLAVFGPERDEQMTQKATMKMVYFTPKYNPSPKVRTGIESFSARNGLWQDNLAEETVHVHSGLQRKQSEIELEDHLSELEGHRDADSVEEHEFYVPKDSEMYDFDSNGQRPEMMFEAELENESEDEDSIPEEHYATAGYKSDVNIYVKKNKGGFSSRLHRHSPKSPRIYRPPMHSHALYRPYALYRPRVGDMVDTDIETNVVDSCPADGPCPPAADTSSSRMKPEMTDTENVESNQQESKRYEQTSKLNYILVGNSYSPFTRGTANAETRPNESETLYVIESAEDESEDDKSNSYPEVVNEDESSTESSVDSVSQRDIRLYTIIRILSDINRVSISIKTVFEGLRYVLERNDAYVPSEYPRKPVLLKQMENVLDAHYRTMSRIKDIVESEEEFKKYFHSGERFFPVAY